jgi:calcium channel MID1
MTLVATCIFALSFIALVRTQVSRQHVPLDSLISLKSTSGATALDIPASSSTLSLSVALCGFSSHPARFFVTNDTEQDPNSILSNAGGDDTWEIPLNDGQGNWTGFASDGALVVFDATDVPLEVAVSTNGKLYCSFNTGDH